jgi:hypothetical protein
MRFHPSCLNYIGWMPAGVKKRPFEKFYFQRGASRVMKNARAGKRPVHKRVNHEIYFE